MSDSDACVGGGGGLGHQILLMGLFVWARNLGWDVVFIFWKILQTEGTIDAPLEAGSANPNS